MSTKKDLTELLAYTVKKAEASTEVKVAWANLSLLEKVLAKQASTKGPVNLGGIRKLASLIEKRSCGSSCSSGRKKMKKKAEGALCGGATKGLKMKKPKLMKSASYQRMYGMLKKASANPRFGSLLKAAMSPPNPVPVPEPSGWDFLKAKTVPELMTGAWRATPTWGRALAVLGGLGLGATGLWAAGKELKHRVDPGADRRLRGMGLPDDVVDALTEFAAKDTARYSQLAGIQDMFERSRPSRVPLYRAGTA